jgi:hypothetical protein
MNNRRKHARYRAAVAAEIELEAELYDGKTRDLSLTGASLLTSAPLVEGANIQLTLFLTEDGIETADAEPLVLAAEVMWVSEQTQGDVLSGLRFAPVNREDTRRIEQLLAALAPA